MQQDMHYNGTYAMARAAGIKRETARLIATCAQFVDDAILDDGIHLDDGRSLVAEMTAHKTIDLKNADPNDQRKVWLPFHFLPGGQGGSMAEKLACRKDSPIAREVVARNLEVAGTAPYGPHLVGITAHVYADTFAHFGFIGACHEMNAVKDGTLETYTDHNPEIHDYIWGKARAFLDRIASSALSDAFPLGHGAVMTFPDRPYLRWSYRRKIDNVLVERNNKNDFIQGCRALYLMFRQYAENVPNHADPGPLHPWASVRAAAKAVIDVEGSKEERAKAWNKALKAGDITGKSETMPKYVGESWAEFVHGLHLRPGTAPEPGKLVKAEVHKFYRAARSHRNTVLTDILPAHGILAA